MKYVEAPHAYVMNSTDIPLFLAGGITNCPNWQQEIVELFHKECGDTSLVLLNPRRDNFPIHDPNASYEQIKWEWNMFRKAQWILFWFARGSLNPIVLFEYGKWMCQNTKKIFVGCDPDYPRIKDVQIQTQLERSDLHIVNNLQSLVHQVKRAMTLHEPC